MTRPDQCPMCGSLNHDALNEDGSRYNPFVRNAQPWDKCRCQECGHVWPFRIIQVVSRREAVSA